MAGTAAQLLSGQGSTITTLLASFGGWGVGDFTNVLNIYKANGNSFQGTQLQTNFQVLQQTFPSISLIEMDVENTYDETSFVAFCQMLVPIGFGITFCPYTAQSFWVNSLAALNQSNPEAVKWWDMQCYAGGTGNNPANWANAITKTIPGFNTDGFILGSDWVLNSDGNGDCPTGVESLLSNFRGESCVGGAFLWTLDTILWQGTQNPNPCGSGATMPAYVAAITNALG
jgi:hypothetical protein